MLPVLVRYVGRRGVLGHCWAREEPRAQCQAQPSVSRPVGVALSLKLIPEPRLHTHVVRRSLCPIAEKRKSLLSMQMPPLWVGSWHRGPGSACPCTSAGMHPTRVGWERGLCGPRLSQGPARVGPPLPIMW